MPAGSSKGARVKAREGYKVGFLRVLREAGRRAAGGGRGAAAGGAGAGPHLLCISRSLASTYIYIHDFILTQVYECRLYRRYEERLIITSL